MKSKVSLIIVLLSVLFIVFGCTKPEELIEFEIYNGETLHIGIIGEAPKVREDNVSFTPIDFSEIENTANLSNYDAIFITKENLVEADKPKYADTYNSSPIPFLFIETTKGYGPFINKEFDFENYPDIDSGAYAYLYDSKIQKYWGFGIYNDEVNERNIQEAYSRIFETIEEISIHKLTGQVS